MHDLIATPSPPALHIKDGFDRLFALTVLVLLSPLLLALALAIKATSPGPVLFRQLRLGLDSRPFHVYKFRSMHVHRESDGQVTQATRDDPRVTPLGRFMRRTSLDELPQFLNVLRGDMSLVGPRPERPEFIGALSEQIPLFGERLTVKAGLTGWAQINYPYGATIEDARAKLGYDLYYVKNFSVLFDLLIIVQTLRVVLFPGAAGAR